MNAMRNPKILMYVKGAVAPVLAIAIVTIAIRSAEAAQTPAITENRSVHRELSLTVGESRVLDLEGSPSSGSIVFAAASESILEAKWLEPTNQLYLRGLSSGFTTLSICEKNKDCLVYDVKVTPDIVSLKKTIAEILPGEKEVRVTADNDRITLSGTVADPASLPQILALSEAYAPGKVTNLMTFYAVPDSSLLKEKIHEMLPDEQNIQVTQSADMLTLSGTVSSTANLAQVVAIAESFTQEGRLMNLLEVGGVQQVMLEVRVAEISKALGRSLGINFGYISDSGRNVGVSRLGALTTPELDEGGLTQEFSDAVSALFTFFGYDASWTVFIDALKETGLAKVLAEPTLITLSGQSASFLAGGEFPYPIEGQNGQITIQFKEFGVKLNFTPTVLSDKKISMHINPVISDLDFTNSVATAGVAVPGLQTRAVDTVIELADGQSFAVAGLLRKDLREFISKYPILGDIPVLGALFRSKSFQKNETELVIIATAHLVKPLDLSQQPLPTDSIVEPNDMEFYLLGRLEGREELAPWMPAAQAGEASQGGMEGDFGHILPK